jgi:hypothetical protein
MANLGDLNNELELALKRLEAEKASLELGKTANSSYRERIGILKQIKSIEENILEKNKLINEEKQRLTELLKTAKEKEAKQIELRLKKLGIEEAELQIQVDSLSILKQQLSLLTTIKNESLEKLRSQRAIFKESFQYFDGLDKSIRKTNISLGLSGERGEELRKSIQGAQTVANRFGVDVAELGGLQKSFADETGRLVILSSEALSNFVVLSKSIGLSLQETGALAGKFDMLGIGSEKAADYMMSVSDISEKMGVNVSKVFENVGNNFNLLNKLNFKDGINAFLKMSAESAKLKVNMQSVAIFAEKVFRPEGAIEAAAQLQILGGGLAKLGDPFRLMYDARNNPEKLLEDISASVSELTRFDAKSKDFKIDAVGMDMLKEASQATGIAVDELVIASKQAAKLNMFDNILNTKGLTKEQKDMFSTMAELNKDGKAVIKIDGKTVFLDELNQTEADRLARDIKNSQQRAEESMALSEQFKAIKNTFMSFTQPIMALLNQLRPVLDTFANYLTNLSDTAKKITGGFMLAIGAIGAVSYWISKGYFLGIGFNKAVGVKGLLGGAAAATGAAASGGKTVLKSGSYVQGGQAFNKDGKLLSGGAKTNVLKAASKQQKMIPTPSPSGVTGKQGGFLSAFNSMSTKNLLAVSAAMVALASSIFIISKALIDLKKADVGMKQLGIMGGILAGLILPLSAFVMAVDKFGGKITKASLHIGQLALALGALSGAIYLMAQGIKVIGESNVTFGQLAGTSMLLTGALIGLRPVLATLPPSITAIGGAAFAVAPGLLALGGTVALVGVGIGAAALGVSYLVDSFAKLFDIVADKSDSLFKMSGAMLTLAAGIAGLGLATMTFGLPALSGLAASVVALSAASLLLDPFVTKINKLFTSIKESNLSTNINLLATLDTNKLKMLKEIGELLQNSKPIKIEFGKIIVDGNIGLEGNNKAITKEDLNKIFNDPIFINKLKDRIFNQKEYVLAGGK